MVFVLIFVFFFTQLFVATVVDTFLSTSDRITGRVFLTEKQREWVDVQGKAHFLPYKKLRKAPENILRRLCFSLVTHPKFDMAILVIIMINTGFLASYHYSAVYEWTQVLTILDYIFGSIYISEAIAKILAFQLAYFRSFRNLFDFFIVLTICLSWALQGSQSGEDVSVFESLRVLRVFRLTMMITGACVVELPG